MEKRDHALGERKPYSKPAVERVRLVTDEAVLAACKVSGEVGQGASAQFCGTGDCGLLLGS